MSRRRSTAAADPSLLRVWTPTTVVAITLVLVAWGAVSPGPARSVVAGVGQLVAALAAAACSFRSRGRTRGCARTWELAGIACLLWAIGQGWLIGAGAVDTVVIRPNLADVFFILAVTTALWAPSASRRSLLLGVVAVVACSMAPSSEGAPPSCPGSSG